MTDYQKNIPIRLWAEDDRPREKLLLKGKRALSNAELIAILLGSGSREFSAVELSKRILEDSRGKLKELSRQSVADLTRTKGIGPAKAVTLIAALELGNRTSMEESLNRKKVSCSRDVYSFFRPLLQDSSYEEFWILLLNRGNKILSSICISQGGLSGTVADPKKIFKTALENYAASVILCHNHPSGNIRPSDSDIRLTQKLKKAGSFLDLPVVDHIIIGENNYFSFADDGLL
ncbi:MAG: DNA repair protein RadC [Bacteroidales bacterium]|nr:DNA repair protein RadC [Bacteroidales bacterium]